MIGGPPGETLMLLIGMLDSPFVRRVAITLRQLGMAHEHGNWSVGRDAERIRAYNPLLRVPTLVLDDGEVLTESSAILDYLDGIAGPARALLPAHGPQRRMALQRISLAIGAAEKARDTVYERQFRPAEKRHEPWLQRLDRQRRGALGELERVAASLGEGRNWLGGPAGNLTQADISITCALTFIRDAGPLDLSAGFPALERQRLRCEALPDFAATYTPFFPPTPAATPG